MFLRQQLSIHSFSYSNRNKYNKQYNIQYHVRKEITPLTTTVSNCNFTIESFKKEDMETLRITAQALLNITEFFKGTTIQVEAMLKIGDKSNITEKAENLKQSKQTTIKSQIINENNNI